MPAWIAPALLTVARNAPKFLSAAGIGAAGDAAWSTRYRRPHYNTRRGNYRYRTSRTTGEIYSRWRKPNYYRNIGYGAAFTAPWIYRTYRERRRWDRY